uniref:ZSWIM3 N-terminal domain-containing protein n=1 Tax=Arion vulgaris TaxID=1028688 RepID=A0A0B7BK03_9EUPU
MNIDMARREDTYQDVNKQNENGDDGAIDTTVDFLRIFQGKTEFDSWEEFNTLFEDFQKETGSAFKPKSATSIEYANERRMKDKIADRFVYQTVKMVCQHYGNPVRRESSTRNIKKYVGLGCEAMVHLRYKGETLNIVSCNLEHRNHKLFSGTEVIRNVRSFSFTDDVDFLMAKAVLEHKPFSTWNSEKEWVALVEDLQSQDPRMKTVTIRVVKKRIRFLIDRYMANSNGKPPVANDEMGVILYELAKAKQDAMDNVSKQPAKKRGRGRPRKKEREETDEDEGMDDAHMDFDDSPTFDPGSSSPDKYRPKKPVTTSSSFVKDISAFLNYMEHKDEQDRKLRQHEVDLRREELELHKKEFELTKEKFEFDRIERQTHLDLLKTQLDIFGGPKSRQLVPDGKIDGNAITEYTIVVNNDQTFTTQ